MLHLHFGTGRLGLGLVAPFFQTPRSQLFLFNRASASGENPTGSTALPAPRRNQLLREHPDPSYLVSAPTRGEERVHYQAFHAFHDSAHVEKTVREVLESSDARKEEGVLVTASVLSAAHYAPVLAALRVLARARQEGKPALGPLYLVACENTVHAAEVLDPPEFQDQVTPVHALVDRVCTDLEERTVAGHPTVVVHVEDYGSLKLELNARTEALMPLLQGSRVEFSRHLDVEKEIKGWLLNGSHWLIALTALQETQGDVDLKLNDYINGSAEHRQYATQVLREMREGIEALLRSEPRYAAFVRDVDVAAYLEGAAASILARFASNEDTLTRILARFRAPRPEEVNSVQLFMDRFLRRIEPPLRAYQEEKGVPARHATEGLFNLFRLQASGLYVDTASAAEGSP